MDLKTLLDTPPWDWPRDAGWTLRKVLVDQGANESDRLIAAELAGDSTVINDDLADTLLTVVCSADEPWLNPSGGQLGASSFIPAGEPARLSQRGCRLNPSGAASSIIPAGRRSPESDFVTLPCRFSSRTAAWAPVHHVPYVTKISRRSSAELPGYTQVAFLGSGETGERAGDRQGELPRGEQLPFTQRS